MTREEFIAHVERDVEALRGFCVALCCGDKAEADDVAQDALVRAYLASADYREHGRFRSWLFKIAHRTFINHRASQRQAESIDEARRVVADTAADSAFEYQSLHLAMRTLPPAERSAITLFYMNGYSGKEIAAITDASEDAVKKQLSRGRDRLREALKN